MIRSDRNSARRLGIGTVLPLLALVVSLLSAGPVRAQIPAACQNDLDSENIIEHDLNPNVSFCELCDVGQVRIIIENPFRPPPDDVGSISNLIVTEDLGGSGLTYVPGSTNFSGIGIAVPPNEEPTVSPAPGNVLTWDLTGDVVLNDEPGFGPRDTLIIDFQVQRHASVDEEGLVSDPRDIQAFLNLEPECAPGETYSTSTPLEELPLREPDPEIIKTGRNLDAGQGSGQYSNPVYGHEGDDVIWRIEVRNTGNAPLQDVVFDDQMAPGNFEIDWVCDSEAAAVNASNGSPGGCVAPTTSTSVVGLDVAAAFGGGANPYIVAPAGGSGFYYLVGRVTSSCLNRDNTALNFEWGCQEDAPAGGITQTSTGASPGTVTAELSTLSDWADLDVDVFLEGANRSQPMGARGTVTIRIRNLTGGTIYHENGIRVRDLLPPEYVIDSSVDPQLLLAPAYGTAYEGMVDTLEWTNPQPGTSPMTSTNPADPLANTDLEFLLTSSDANSEFPDQVNMIRHGDTVRIRFRTVLIDPTFYDKVADLDIREEAPDSDPTPGTDPDQASGNTTFPISNFTEIWFEEFCTDTVEHNLQFTDNDTAEPEDLDIDIVGTELVFILTNTGDPLPLSVELTNRGGHDAQDYEAYVTFGEAMVVQTAPAGCSATANPPAFPVWQNPTTLPATASVYRCFRGTISPGEVETFDFTVVKNTAASFDDDLTFRADVIGEIHLAADVPQPGGGPDASQLWFPTPTARPDGITDRANNYSIDAVWARVVGYNLFKEQLGTCSENNPPPNFPTDPDDQVQIGEECSFHIESGGWFGFRTPGFQYIAVQDIQVVDPIPDGQAYVSSTDPIPTSTAAIMGVSLNPPPAPLEEIPFDWTFNTVVPAERITEKDHWFRVDVTTRLLNDQVDQSLAPNAHSLISTNILTSTFQAVFFNDSTMMEEVYDLGPNTVGFPREVHRRVDLTVTEPELSVVKEVCNEGLYGSGASCTNWTTLANDGDAFDTYVFRIQVTNEAADSGVARAPAYDVTVTSVADASDRLEIIPLGVDTVDDDGDGDVDGADADGEGTITDNTINNGNPANVIASYTHSDALLRIDPGETVTLYYRVDPDDNVSPLQLFTNRVSLSYDSLEGDAGNQSAPQGANGELEGARQYELVDGAEAQIQIIPVETTPKQITALANTPLSAPVTPQPVSVGEEIEFDLHALIPVAQLRQFVIRDELPPGLTCSEAPTINLTTDPAYVAAAFDPGGEVIPTCTDTEVVWDLGDQTVTMSDRTDRRFDFAVQFIARVDNILANQDGSILTNGDPSTVTEVRYIDEADVQQIIPIDEVSVLVQEPVIALEKTFDVAQGDAADVVTVTVTATNNGNADAYNLRVLDDLAAVELSYVGNLSGTDPPTADLSTFGPDSPLFVWAPGFAIAPTESVTFTFDVSLDGTVQPLEVLPNTIQADWTSLPGDDTALNSSGSIGADGSATGMRNGALPNAGDDLNDYETEANAQLSVPPLTIEKIDLDPALVPAIGAHKPFELVISLPEGTTEGLLATDDLASGAESYVLADNADFDVVYVFEGIASINGLAPSEAALTAVPADGTSGLAVWDIGTVVTDSEDDLTVNDIDPAIRITYHGRVNNDGVTDRFDALQNGVVVNYTNGDTGGQEALPDDTPPIVTVEPVLTATKALTNVTGGKAPGDPPQLGDTLQYVVTVPNSGDSTAHDVNIVDTLPPEVQLFAGFTPTAEINGNPVAGFVATPAGAPGGPLVWGRLNGAGDESLDIPDGQSLVLTYQVTVTQVLPGTTIENEIWVDWTSLDGPSPYERTGDGCPSFTPPDDYCFGPAVAVGSADPLPPIGPLEKLNTQDSASIGEPFTWIIRVPETPYPYDIFDVEIRDDLTQPVTGAVLRLLSITETSGSVSWTPVNNGTDTDLIIVGSGGGIDIAAGDQVELEITVVLEDDPANVDGNPFTNTASFFYHLLDGDSTPLPGDSATTDPPMTVVEPDLTLTKSGPASMVIGTPETFTLDVQNVGDGPAWNTTITDNLPELPTVGGTCDTPPANVSVERVDSGGASLAVLDSSSDYSTTWDPSPACLLTITVLTDVGTMGPGERLIVSYDAQLDADTPDAASLTNIAGAVEWFSWEDTSPDRRTYTEVVTDGTPAILDFQDAFTVDATLPGLRFDKTVSNLTASVSPATTAAPGDLLEYELVITNVDGIPLDDFSIVDDLGSLNGTPVFEPNTLVVSTPSGTDLSDPTGGTNGTGMLEVSGLSLPALNDSVTITFQIQLASPLPNGTLVTNQSQIVIGGVPFLDSDDPNVNGPADPDIAGDEDPTQLTIQSAPDFLVEKTSAYLTGDPTVLLAGETLQYTITVVNVGTEDAIDVTLRDAIPANTTYVPNSTTLNGGPVADVGGLSPLVAGLLIEPLGGGPAGSMPADPTADPNNVATIVFSVVVDPNVADGTIISNQAFVTSIPGGVIDDPSDDPDTPTPDDPTRDVVGDLPLLFASKDAALLDDTNGNGVVDGGDSLLYTITVFNSGAVDATNVALQDMVPASTSYRAGSTTLNTDAVTDPGPGAFPLAQVGGLPISSSDLTPPLPGAGAGTISSLQSATVTFILDVDPLATPGTVISNQATITSNEVPNLLTDGDGDPSTGPEPTIVVVGGGQTLSITKQVVVVGGGAVLPGSVLEYTVRVVNAGTEDATSVMLSDDLDADTANTLTLVPGSATMNASTTGVAEAGNVITADYSTSYGPLAPGEVIVLRFQAVVMATLVSGDRITNTGVVEWDTPTQTAMASVSVDVGGMPGVGVLNGAVWHDANFDDVQDATERDLFGWSVDLYRNGSLVQSTTTDASGAWSIAGLAPNDVSGDQYELRFRQPGAGSNTAALGRASSPFTNGLQFIGDILVTSGSNLQDLDLPIDPNGVVYDALLRAPLSGAALTLLDAGNGTPVSTDCLEDPVQQGQVTGADGYYKFDLIFGDLSCQVGGNYLIAVAPPGAGYAAGASQLISPATDATTAPLLVPSCPGGVNDAVAAPAGYCEAQDSEFAPPPTIPPGSAGTTYFLHLGFDDSNTPGSQQIFNNHIPVDPVLDGAVAISKTTPSTNVSRGSLVPYEIVVTNDLGAPIPDLGILDRIPPGFQYVDGSARVDGVPTEPILNGRELLWENVGIDANSSRTLVVLLAVGAGVSDGEYVNRAQAVSTATSLPLSGEALATVRVVPDPTFACTDVMGKVFDDKNRNGAQDPGELGLGGVRVVTARGLVATTDQHGRYHFTCATVPNDYRGSNFILKLDDRSLPSGFRMSGGATQVKRATRGKALRFNFGASIHRVVSLDMADPVFEPGSAEIRPQWTTRLGLLMDELKKAPSVLRLSYVADVEDADLVEERLEEVKARISETWKALDGETYPLTIEPEIYWRRGAPPAAPALRSREEQ